MSVTVSRLANGMRVVTHAMPHLETVSLGVWVGAGARFESANQHGISHLLEHMAFKGTSRRSPRDIAEQIESVGGELNASTSLETTSYYARVLKNDVALALDIIADILRDSRFDEAELVREREVVLQEIAAVQDCPDDIAYDLAQEAAFPGQALGRPILGTSASVRGFGRQDLAGYMGRHYLPGAMVVAAAGAVEHEAVVRLAEAAFADLAPAPAATADRARYGGGMRGCTKPFEQSHMVMAFRGPSYRDPSYYPAQVLCSLLGGGMSSRLFQQAREERGLCYAIYSYCWGLADTGLFGIYAATGDEQMDDLLRVLSVELERVAAHRPLDDEIARAKAQLKAGLMMSLESSSSRAEQLARQMLAFGRPLAIEELTAKVEGVSGESVRALAEELFSGATASVALVGSQRAIDGVEAFAARFAQPGVQAAE